jgi:carbamoyltransferase
VTVHIGIHDGHNATVAVLRNGELVFCQSEERFTRVKNVIGFPERTLRYVYERVCSPTEVASCTIYQESTHGYRRHRGDFKDEFGVYLSPALSFEAGTEKHDPELGYQFARASFENNTLTDLKDTATRRDALQYYARLTELPPERVLFSNHHLSHALSCIPFLGDDERVLIFTLDGGGDDLCATVGILEGDEYRTIDRTHRWYSLGLLYRQVTGLLGMKMDEHEYKVMGLAPYAREEHYRPILEQLRRLLWVDEAGRWRMGAWSPAQRNHILYDIVKFRRFDLIAGALQALTEELITTWVRTWVRRTGIRSIACAGGVFMNVKANQVVAALDEVERCQVVPSCGDESAAIGAAINGSIRVEPGVPIRPARGAYFGREYTDEEVRLALEATGATERYAVSRPEDIAVRAADLLAAGEVVARCSGPMEFGARSLGNRSILADPSRPDVVMFINEAVKNRDFWMPFAPSILADHAGLYLENPKCLSSPYMMFAFDSTPLGRKQFAAAMHRYDFTLRAQLLVPDWNPDYAGLIAAFAKRTGIHGLLNTSFNLHGEPVVCSPEDAIHTMDRSGLRCCVIGDWLLEKRA